jgi:hypothetical protein
MFQPGDFVKIIIPFKYIFLRSYFPNSKRWGDKIHIALDEDYIFTGEQVEKGHPICGRLEGEHIFTTALKPWTPGRKKSVKVCQNCLTKLMSENKLHIETIER